MRLLLARRSSDESLASRPRSRRTGSHRLQCCSASTCSRDAGLYSASGYLVSWAIWSYPDHRKWPASGRLAGVAAAVDFGRHRGDNAASCIGARRITVRPIEMLAIRTGRHQRHMRLGAGHAVQEDVPRDRDGPGREVAAGQNWSSCSSILMTVFETMSSDSTLLCVLWKATSISFGRIAITMSVNNSRRAGAVAFR